ncbi:MAG: TIR domain-containing protein [Bacteroidia bacterium]|nr:TIR domain-containing protein [Bacteroidia bacterium]
MSKSIFISCVFEDSHRIASIKKWASDNRLGDVVITQETEDKRQQGKEAVKQHIKSKIQGAAVILVLVGQDTHNHEWIEAEVELANSFNKEIICVRIPHTTGAVPPLLTNKRLISFDPEAIKKLIS